MEQHFYGPLNYKDVKKDFLKKGDVISIDCFGNGQLQRFKVLKINDYIATLLCIDHKTAFNSQWSTYARFNGDGQVFATFANDYNNPHYLPSDVIERCKYADGNTKTSSSKISIDYALNNVFYNLLTTRVKDAIIPCTIYQYCYEFAENLPNSGRELETIGVITEQKEGYYTRLNLFDRVTVGERYCYIPDITDILEYFNISPESINSNLYYLSRDQLSELFPFQDWTTSYAIDERLTRSAALLSDAGSLNYQTLIFSPTHERTSEGDIELSTFWARKYDVQNVCMPMFKIDLANVPIVKEEENEEQGE